jgi:hypothetical protein
MLVAMLAAGPHSANAQQTGTVSGTVTDSVTGTAVANATIVLESPAVTRQGKTAADGKFSIGELPPGAYHLVARPDGYLASRSELTVAGGAQTADLQTNPGLHFSEVTSSLSALASIAASKRSTRFASRGRRLIVSGTVPLDSCAMASSAGKGPLLV